MNVAQNVLPDEAKRITSALGQPCLFSRSVKLTANAAAGSRWLLTLPETTCSSQQEIESTLQKILPFCKNTPLPLHPQALQPIAIHIGYDQEDNKQIRKLYYEYDSCSDLVFISTKDTQGHAETHFYRSTQADETLGQIGLQEPLESKVRNFLNTLPADTPALEVTTSASPRHSLDVNLMEIQQTSMCRAALSQIVTEINHSKNLKNALNDASISHVAVGLTANGSPFVTLYGEPYWIVPHKTQD